MKHMRVEALPKCQHALRAAGRNDDGNYPTGIQQARATQENGARRRHCALVGAEAAAAMSLLLFLAAATAPAQDIAIRSPSGNIHCLISGEVRCDLADVASTLPRPQDCTLDWGGAYGVGPTGPAAALCAGDTIRDPEARVLGYGQSVRRAGITCTSAKDGMTCRNAEGHGFTVSRLRQRIFRPAESNRP